MNLPDYFSREIGEFVQKSRSVTSVPYSAVRENGGIVIYFRDASNLTGFFRYSKKKGLPSKLEGVTFEGLRDFAEGKEGIFCPLNVSTGI